MSRVAPAIAACALIAGALFATPAPSPAQAVEVSAEVDPASAPAPAPAPALTLAPANDGVATPGSELQLAVEIANPSDGRTVDTPVTVSLGDTAFDSVSALGSWLDGSDASGEAGAAPELAPVTSVASTVVSPGVTHTVQVTLPAAQLDAALDSWGVYPVSVSATIDGVTTVARSTIVWNDPAASAPAPADLTVIAPITSVASSTGLIQPAALEAFTSDSGVLTRELEAVIDQPVTIAVDPRIIVSIRALGSAAPDSAVAWLQRLDQASNPIIPLTFGDSDISGERQAGATQVLQPTSFSYALRGADFTDVDELIEPTATPDAGVAAASPSPTPSASTVPTLEQLLAWDYTSSTIAWPRGGTVVGDDLPVFASSGYERTIVDSEQLSATPEEGDPAPAPMAATARVGDQQVLVSDHVVSSALHDALSATTGPGRDAAYAALSASLAVAAEHGIVPSGSPGVKVLAVLDRETMNLGDLGAAMAVVSDSPWSQPSPLDTLLTGAFEQPLTLTDAPQPAERIERISALLSDARGIDAFSSVLLDPSLLSGSQQANLLALLSNAWTTNTGGWSVAVDAARETTATTLGAVQIVDGSNINMVANQANLPVTLSNELPYPVNVVVHVTPSNGRLVVEKSDIEVTIEANSRKGAQIPLEAGVANGPVTLRFQVLSPTGVLVSVPSPVLVNVSADWETWGTVIVAILLVLLFGFGLVRNILRRRKRIREATDDTDATDETDASHG
ncbi:DUF6049 family protein [Herbiconiux sp. A18JL235]|uniref:DUF6049 family protein n=1 Tax=Herbiconiux sp. A18JL235 TaxID=3152363 RepID=A0AB39BGN6_9MICO